MSEPTCRGCYAATLTPAMRERFYAEPVTSCIYWCNEHQRAMDEVLNSLPQVQYIKAMAAAFEPPALASVTYCNHMLFYETDSTPPEYCDEPTVEGSDFCDRHLDDHDE